MKLKENNKKVYVGLSGGVDSSVSAALLKKQGYEVTGIFIKAWYPDFLDCDWKSEKRDAMRVCVHLDIPFKVLDLSKEYKEEIIDYMVKEYKEGRTPNPDVMCNKHIKFGSFFDWAIKEGADYVATGHYAQVKKSKENKDKYTLVRSKDKDKDQTYFLWNLTQEKLEKTIFPVGNYTKQEVRKWAKKFDLFTNEKKDSQGLCFLGHLDIKSFLKEYIKTESGEVLNTSGEVIGSHEGAVLYTIGERHGFKINKQSPEDKPLYVISKNIKANTIIVANNKPKLDTSSKEYIALKEENFISGSMPKNDIEASIRYRQKPIPAILENKGGKLHISFKEETEDVAPGQSIVFYNNDICLGGGVVVE